MNSTVFYSFCARMVLCKIWSLCIVYRRDGKVHVMALIASCVGVLRNEILCQCLLSLLHLPIAILIGNQWRIKLLLIASRQFQRAGPRLRSDIYSADDHKNVLFAMARMFAYCCAHVLLHRQLYRLVGGARPDYENRVASCD